MAKNDYYMVSTIRGSNLVENGNSHIEPKKFSNENKAKQYFENEKSEHKTHNIYLEKRNKVYPHKTKTLEFYNGDK